MQRTPGSFTTPRRVTLLVLMALAMLHCHGSMRSVDWVAAEVPEPIAAEMTHPNEASAAAKADPLGFLQSCRDFVAAHYADYRCLFHKQEFIHGQLGDVQVMNATCRENPFSVELQLLEGGGPAKRVSFAAGRLYDKNGEELMVVEPSGLIGALISQVTRPVRGEAALRITRRTADEFGFLNSLDLILDYCRRAQGQPEYELTYLGVGEVAGRPTHAFRRRLPYREEDSSYPDRLLYLHIDQEFRVPVAVSTFSDDEGKNLLGRYLWDQVEFNVGLTDADFLACREAAATGGGSANMHPSEHLSAR